MSQDLVTVKPSQIIADLHWLSSRIFDVLGTWAGEAENAAVAVSMATTSRHLSWHVSDLAELIPEPEIEDGDEDPGPLHPVVSEALDSIQAIPGTVERLGVTHRVLIPRLAVECVNIERGSKPDDDPDPLVDIARAMLDDLRRDRDDGEVILCQLIVDIATVQRVGERVLEAERRLVEAGGLLPITLA